MTRPTILTTITTAQGWSCLLYRQGTTYPVGVLSSHRRPIPLADSAYATYAAAHDRLLQEAQQRHREETTGRTSPSPKETP